MARISRRGKGKLDCLVVQKNDIIQKTQYALTEQQQNILLSMITEVKMDDAPDTIYKFNIHEFAEAFNLNMDGGYYYKAIKDDIDTIDKQRMLLINSTNPKQGVRLRWLNVLRWDDGIGEIEYNFHEDMRPFLFEIQSRFTQFKLKYAAVLPGRYAKKLYALFKSWEHMETIIEKSIDELRILMDAEQYDRYVDFKRFVIKPSIEAINKYTDIQVYLYPGEMEGRSYKTMRFSIHPVYNLSEFKERKDRLNERLGIDDE